MTAEEYIKSKLDGYFFTLGTRGEGIPYVFVRKVAKDFILPYASIVSATEVAQAAVRKRLPPPPTFTQEQDEQLIELRHKGYAWELIATRMKKNRRTLRMRYDILAKERNLPPVVLRPLKTKVAA
jgi:hypothetical protein